METPRDARSREGSELHEASSKEEAIAQRMHDKDATALEKGLAAVTGAAEGFAEISRTANLPAVAGAAVEKTVEAYRQVRDGFREGAGTQAGAAAGTTTTPGAPGAGESPPSQYREKVSEATERMTRVTEGFGEAAHRAATAPTAIAYEAKAAAREVVNEAKAAAVGYGIAALGALFALAFFSVAIAVGLNYALGGQWGTVIVGVLYAILAAYGLSRAKRGVAGAKEHTRDGLENVKAEARHEAQAIKRPIRESFRGRPGA